MSLFKNNLSKISWQDSVKLTKEVISYLEAINITEDVLITLLTTLEAEEYSLEPWIRMLPELSSELRERIPREVLANYKTKSLIFKNHNYANNKLIQSSKNLGFELAKQLSNISSKVISKDAKMFRYTENILKNNRSKKAIAYVKIKLPKFIETLKAVMPDIVKKTTSASKVSEVVLSPSLQGEVLNKQIKAVISYLILRLLDQLTPRAQNTNIGTKEFSTATENMLLPSLTKQTNKVISKACENQNLIQSIQKLISTKILEPQLAWKNIQYCCCKAHIKEALFCLFAIAAVKGILLKNDEAIVFMFMPINKALLSCGNFVSQVYGNFVLPFIPPLLSDGFMALVVPICEYPSTQLFNYCRSLSLSMKTQTLQNELSKAEASFWFYHQYLHNLPKNAFKQQNTNLVSNVVEQFNTSQSDLLQIADNLYLKQEEAVMIAEEKYNNALEANKRAQACKEKYVNTTKNAEKLVQVMTTAQAEGSERILKEAKEELEKNKSSIEYTDKYRRNIRQIQTVDTVLLLSPQTEETTSIQVDKTTASKKHDNSIKDTNTTLYTLVVVFVAALGSAVYSLFRKLGKNNREYLRKTSKRK